MLSVAENITISAGKAVRIKVYHHYYLYNNKDYILTEFSVESSKDISSIIFLG